MKTKLSFLIVAISVCMSALAVEVPAKLFVRGTALAESSVAMEMKRTMKIFQSSIWAREASVTLMSCLLH